IDRVAVDAYLPEFLSRPRVGGIRLFGWLALLLIVPLLYRLIAVIGVLCRPLFAFFGRRYRWVEWMLALGPGPIRLFILAIVIRLIVSLLDLPLLERQFWGAVERILVTIAVAWQLLALNETGEESLRGQLPAAAVGEMTAMLRLGR